MNWREVRDTEQLNAFLKAFAELDPYDKDVILADMLELLEKRKAEEPIEQNIVSPQAEEKPLRKSRRSRRSRN